MISAYLRVCQDPADDGPLACQRGSHVGAASSAGDARQVGRDNSLSFPPGRRRGSWNTTPCLVFIVSGISLPLRLEIYGQDGQHQLLRVLELARPGQWLLCVLAEAVDRANFRSLSELDFSSCFLGVCIVRDGPSTPDTAGLAWDFDLDGRS